MKRDLTGERFGRLTVIGIASEKGNKTYWRCKCGCGKEVVVEHYHLTEGRTKSCGCMKPGRKAEDLTGKRFGRLTVIEPASKGNKEDRTAWVCRCDCGNTCVCLSTYLKRGSTKSCGCLREDHQREAIKTSVHVVDGTCIEKISSKAMFSNNTSGTRGVYNNGAGKWKAAIGFQGKVYNLGTYADYDDAVAARKEAEENLYVPFLENYKKRNSGSEKSAAAD